MVACDDGDFESLNSMGGQSDMIWSFAPYNSFTDLVELDSTVYCCFREGAAHVANNAAEHGIIRIIWSVNGITWLSLGEIRDVDYDLRDPKLSVAPDGSLHLLFGCLPTDGVRHSHTRVKIISPEEIEQKALNPENIFDVNIENSDRMSSYWLWKTKWIDGTNYGVAYQGSNKPLFVKSTDGINYSLVSMLNVAGNEADVEKLPDGRMLMVIRDQNETSGFIGTAEPPYSNWDWETSNNLIQCPDIITVDGMVLVAGRSLWGTTVFQYQGGNRLTPLVNFAVMGDNAYPGMIVRDEHLWVSYYSTTGGHSTYIFLSKIPLSNLHE